LLKSLSQEVCTGTVCCITVWTTAPTSGFTTAPCNNQPLYYSSDAIVGICGTVAQTSDTPMYASDNCDLTPLNFLGITPENLCDGTPVCARDTSTPPSALNIGPADCTTSIGDCNCSISDCTYAYQVWGLHIKEIIFPGVFETTVTVQDCGGGMYAVTAATPITITGNVFPFYENQVLYLDTIGGKTGCANGATAVLSPDGAFIIDNILYNAFNTGTPYIDYYGMFFSSTPGVYGGIELNFWGCVNNWQVYLYYPGMGYSIYNNPQLIFQ